MKFRYILLALLLACSGATANDSLENILRHAKGSDRATVLLQLAYTHYGQSKNKGFASANEALSLARAAHSEKLTGEAHHVLGVLFQRSSMFDSALAHYTGALQSVAQSEDLSKIFDNMGIIYKQVAKYDSALYFHENALKLQSTTGSVAGRAYSLNNIGNVYLIRRNFQRALEYYSKSMEIRKEAGMQAEVAASLLNIGQVYTLSNRYTLALDCFDQALEIRIAEGDDKNVAYLYNSIGNFYLQLKIYDKAREYYSKALKMHQRMLDPEGEASALNNIGTVHRDLANNQKALEYYTRALEIRRREGLVSAQAYTLNSIGGLYWNQKEYDRAKDYYQQSLELREKLGNRILVAHSLKSLGMICKDEGSTSKALELYDRALKAFTAESDLESIASIQNLKGNLYRKLSEYDKAQEYYAIAQEIYLQTKNKQGLAHTLNNIGLTYTEWGKPELAIKTLTEATAEAALVLDRNLEKDIALALSELFKQKKQFEPSLQYFQRYASLKDSIQANESRKRIAEIEFENEMTVKDREIANQQLEIHGQNAKIAEQRIFLFGFLGIITIIAIFSILLYRQFAQKKQAYNEIEAQKELLKYANASLEKKNDELAEMNEKVTDSIIYAKKIQDAILPHDELFRSMLPDSFVLYRPRDIVSGDFYWIHQQGSKVYVAAADCTGHGVPGAFMSMIGNTLLNELVLGKNMSDPAQIITEMDKGVTAALKQHTGHISKQEDGMEMSLCIIDHEAGIIEFAGTDQKVIVIRDSGAETFSGNLFPIGGMYTIKQRKKIPYEKRIIPIEPGMVIYLLSDGYIDQFGGPEDQRFNSNRLLKLLSANWQMDMPEQYHLLRREFEAWKGAGRQIDDVLVVGIRF